MPDRCLGGAQPLEVTGECGESFGHLAELLRKRLRVHFEVRNRCRCSPCAAGNEAGGEDDASGYFQGPLRSTTGVEVADRIENGQVATAEVLYLFSDTPARDRMGLEGQELLIRGHISQARQLGNGPLDRSLRGDEVSFCEHGSWLRMKRGRSF